MNSDTMIHWPQFGVGVLLSAITAWICIHLFLNLIEKIGFTPFVIYRVLLSATLICVLLY